MSLARCFHSSNSQSIRIISVVQARSGCEILLRTGFTKIAFSSQTEYIVGDFICLTSKIDRKAGDPAEKKVNISYINRSGLNRGKDFDHLA